MSLIAFAEWRPDVSALNSAYSSDVINVLCGADFYIPCPSLAPFSTGMTDTPLGGITARDSSGSPVIFAGTAESLWQFNSSTLGWTDVSQTGVTYNASEAERWRFRQFGDYVVATNVNDAMQVFQIGTSTEFADLGGSPPRARHLAVWGDQLAAMNGRTVAWSDIDDITEWSAGNSGSQTFPDGDDIQGSTDATNPLIIQKSAIRLATFQPGSQEVYTFQKLHDKRGAAAPYSIASRGMFTFFADAGAFYQITPDGQIIPIGFEKVDRTVFAKIAPADIENIIGEVDPFFSRVYFAVRYNSSSSVFDRILVYDWNLQRWTQMETETGVLFPLASGTTGYTLDNLTDLTGYSLDELPFSLDSNVWSAGAPVMAAFDGDNKLGFFSGTNAKAILTTQEIGATTGEITLVQSIHPIIDATDLTCAIGTRNRRGDTVAYTAEIAPTTATGRIDKLSSARFQRFRFTIPEGEGWTSAQGADIRSRTAGYR